MSREFELKYAATPQILEAVARQRGGFSVIAMETTYFDTPARTLSTRKMTLRLRRENGVSICTLKTPLPDGSRGEWECESADIHSGIAALLSMGAPDLLRTLGPVEAVCGARFTRRCRLLPTADGTAELALDEGVLSGGGREQPLCELELELKSGSQEAAVALAEELAARYSLREEPKSKFRRAMDLAEGE